MSFQARSLIAVYLAHTLAMHFPFSHYTAMLATKLLVMAGAIVVGTATADEVDTSLLVDEISVEQVMEHLEAFQLIADENGGVRTDLSGGYQASSDYVAQNLPDWYTIERQPFEYIAYMTTSNATLQIDGLPDLEFMVDYADMPYSGAGNLTNVPVAFVNPVLPPTPEPTSTDGCFDEDYANINVTDKIVILQRGGNCTFTAKALRAQDNGAAAVIIFNEGQPDRRDLFYSFLRKDANISIPVMVSAFEIGDYLYNVTRNDTEFAISMSVSAVLVETTTHNLIATSPGESGDAIVVGAHLDSGDESAGMNNNGSGNAAILVVATALENYVRSYNITLRNQVRFIWFGAGEVELLGSQVYVNSLDETNMPLLMLNFAMLGSPNFVRFVQTESPFFPVPQPGSMEITQVFKAYFASIDLPVDDFAPGFASSDFGPFATAGIPVGGVFAGGSEPKTEEQAVTYGGVADEPADPCLYLECDDINNINETILGQFTKAAAHATLFLASVESGPTTSGASHQPFGVVMIAVMVFFGTFLLY